MGLRDVTVVAAQVPITESELASSNGQTEADRADPLLAATSTTTLPGPCAQAPIGSTQVSPLSLSRGSEPVQIPTLDSEGPGGQAKLDDWPTCTSAFNRVKSVEHDYCIASDDHEMCWDENIDPYYARNVTCRPMRGAFHAPVPFTDLSHGIDRSRTFRPLDRGHDRMSKRLLRFS